MFAKLMENMYFHLYIMPVLVLHLLYIQFVFLFIQYFFKHIKFKLLLFDLCLNSEARSHIFLILHGTSV